MIMLYAGWKHALYALVRIAYPDKCENKDVVEKLLKVNILT